MQRVQNLNLWSKYPKRRLHYNQFLLVLWFLEYWPQLNKLKTKTNVDLQGARSTYKPIKQSSAVFLEVNIWTVHLQNQISAFEKMNFAWIFFFVEQNIQLPDLFNYCKNIKSFFLDQTDSRYHFFRRVTRIQAKFPKT